MKNAFEKYFLSLVFILISGFALLHANSFFDANYQFDEAKGIHLAGHSNAAFEFHSDSGNYTDYAKNFIELTETEESESLSGESRKSSPVSAQDIFAVFYYVFAWEVEPRTPLDPSAQSIAFQTGQCKKYIRFEVFRI